MPVQRDNHIVLNYVLML